MVNTLKYILPTRKVSPHNISGTSLGWLTILQPCNLNLRSRLYSSTSNKPLNVAIPTRCALATGEATRFPCIESFLEDATLQPYVHDCIINVLESNNMYWFVVFFKCHCRLRRNKSLAQGDRKWTSLCRDILVMWLSSRTLEKVVNMRGQVRLGSQQASTLIILAWIDLVTHHRFAMKAKAIWCSAIPWILMFRKSIWIRGQNLQKLTC